MLRFAIVFVVGLAAACAGDVDDGDGDGDALEPPLDRIFYAASTGPGQPRDWIEDPVAHAASGGALYFDDRSCWIPDFDSYDSFEDPSVGIPPGVTPVSAECPADGKATGPVQFGQSGLAEDLLPSKWCKTDAFPCP
jgi:hypothetical protein